MSKVFSLILAIGIFGTVASVAVWPVSAVEEMEPVRKPEPKDDGSGPDSGDDTMNQPQPYENLDPDAGKSEQQVADEITGQLSFNFDD